MHRFLAQGIQRVAALGIPLAVVFLVRVLAEESFQTIFFQRITDAVLLVALFKIGVDSYIPSCGAERSKVEVSVKWRILWIICLIVLYLASSYMFFQSGDWKLPIIVLVSTSALLIAEISRLSERYLTFYLLKAPVIYVVVLLACALEVGIFSGYESLLFPVLTALSLVVVWSAIRQTTTAVGESDTKNLILASLLSILVVTYSWKEAILARHFLNGSELPAIVFYTRLMLIVTFPYMLRNARIPAQLKGGNKLETIEKIPSVLRKGVFFNVVWSVVTGASIILATAIFEREYSIPVAILVSSTFVLVLTGNIIACLIVLREYSLLLLIHAVGLGLFFLVMLFVAKFSDAAFFIVSVSTLFGQAAVAVMLLIAVRNLSINQKIIASKAQIT